MFESLHQMVIAATRLVCHGLANQSRFSNTGESTSSQLLPPEPHGDLVLSCNNSHHKSQQRPFSFLKGRRRVTTWVCHSEHSEESRFAVSARKYYLPLYASSIKLAIISQSYLLANCLQFFSQGFTLLSAAMIFSAISCSDISQVSPFLPSSIKSQVAF